MKRARKDAKSFRWSALQTVMLTMPFVGASVCEKMVNAITVNYCILFFLPMHFELSLMT